MSKLLFDDDNDEDIRIKTDNEYANKYNTWRQKEELYKLQTKYGEEAVLNYEKGSDESSSSDDDEEAIEFTEEVEKDFYKTLALLKRKDPKIYDKNTKFFEHVKSEEKLQKKKKEKAMYINDYERKMLLEKGGVYSDSEEENYKEDDLRNASPTYVEEQKKLKESFNKVLHSEDEDEGWGGIFQKRKKTNEEKQKEEEEYKEWLKGQKQDITDENMARELSSLKEYWNDPNLDKKEKFLRDYILNKRFLDDDDTNHIPTYEEIVHDSDENLSEDEKQIEKQEEFEHKYNFRFEEPDQEFIKRYPRTMENSLRKTDDRRKLKRAEIKQRKEEEKKQKQEELKQLKVLKRKEIEEKIDKLREITGDATLGFQDEDLDGDFDPELHDKRMQQLFNDEYYKEEEIQKPECPEIEDELEIDNWDKWHKEHQESSSQDAEENWNESMTPHCEDEDFNMDCDYDPEATQKELIENSKGKKKRRKRQSKFAKIISQPKPKFDPKDKSYQQYLDEYYKLDYEDMIGDIPCRFKYREVVPNSFGLSIEEILMANDRELNKWCSLKKAIQYRPENVEKYEVIAYSRKGQNEDLKRKALPSLFQPENSSDNENDAENDVTEKNNDENISTIEDGTNSKNHKEIDSNNKLDNEKDKRKKKEKNKSHKTPGESFKDINVLNINCGESEIIKEGAVEKAVTAQIKKKKRKNKKKASNEEKNQNVENNIKKRNDGLALSTSGSSFSNKKRKRKQSVNESTSKKQKVGVDKKKPNAKRTKKGNQAKTKILGISDARLEAFGINPKKYKNKIKYGNKK